MTRRTITEDQARAIMEAGDIPGEFRTAARRVAVVLTQGWCPQWRAMNSYLSRMEWEKTDDGLVVYELVYDRLPFFYDFMHFKETRFDNEHIPYVRYYRDGGFVGESNYIGEAAFLGMLDG